MGCSGSKPTGPKPEYTLRFMIIGDRQTGKQSLLTRFVDGKFPDSPKYPYEKSSDEWEETEVCKAVIPDLQVDGLPRNHKTCDVKIFIKAARAVEANFRTQSIKNPFRGVNGLFLVYDVSRESTISFLQTKIRDIKKFGMGQISMILLGNKCDISSASVDRDQAKGAARYAFVNQKFHSFVLLLLIGNLLRRIGGNNVSFQSHVQFSSYSDVLCQKRQLTSPRNFAMENDLKILEVSSLEGSFVEEAFARVATMCVELELKKQRLTQS